MDYKYHCIQLECKSITGIASTSLGASRGIKGRWFGAGVVISDAGLRKHKREKVREQKAKEKAREQKDKERVKSNEIKKKEQDKTQLKNNEKQEYKPKFEEKLKELLK